MRVTILLSVLALVAATATANKLMVMGHWGMYEIDNTTAEWEAHGFGAAAPYDSNNGGLFSGQTSFIASTISTNNLEGYRQTFGGVTYNPMLKKFVATVFDQHALVTIDPANGWAMEEFAGTMDETDSTAMTTSGQSSLVGTNAVLEKLFNVVTAPNGDTWVGTETNNRPLKISPDGTVTAPFGQIDAGNGALDGVGTSAEFEQPHSVAIDNTGETLYTFDSLHAVRKVVLSTGAVTTLIGNSGTDGFDDGVGTNAEITATAFNFPTVSGDYLYWLENDGGKTFVRRVDINVDSTTFKTTERFAGDNAGVITEWQDGVGTDIKFADNIDGLLASDDGQSLYVIEHCLHASVIRKIDIATRTSSVFSGSPTQADCANAVTADEATKVTKRAAQAGDKNFMHGFAMVEVQKFCGQFFATWETVDLAGLDCEEDIGGQISVLTIPADTLVKISEDTDITGALTLSDDGQIFVNGAALTADSASFSEDSVYQILVTQALVDGGNHQLTVANGASLAGTLVMKIARDYTWAPGQALKAIRFATHLGNWDRIFVVKEFVKTKRALLQNDGNGADVVCTDASGACTATSKTITGDDDDEIALIVALAVVGSCVLLGLLAACLIVAKKKSDQAPSIVAAQSRGDVEFEKDGFYSYSSSSSSYGYDGFGF